MKRLLYLMLLLLIIEKENQVSACLLFNSTRKSKNCKDHRTLNSQNENKAPLAEIPQIERCVLFANNGNCGQCMEAFVLYNEECVLSTCDKFTGCLFCEYKYCIMCKEGFIMSSSDCKENESVTNDQLVIILSSLLSIVIILNIVIIVILILKRITRQRKEKVQSPPIIIKNNSSTKNKEDETSNQQKNQPDLIIGNVSFNASNDSLMPTSTLIQYQGIELATQSIQLSVTSRCIVCYSDKIYVLLNCGCELCFAHYLEYIKQPAKLKVCNTHKVKLIKSYIVQNLSYLDSNQSDILNINHTLRLCPICKKTPGIISLNCGCNSRLCDKCFKDIIKMVNYYQCPTCQSIVAK